MSIDFKMWVQEISAFIWGVPMMVLLLGGGLFLTFRLGFFQIRYFKHVLEQTVGRLFKRMDQHEGTITPLQAYAAALGGTAGATNIIGVSVAISLGGPGALFWMWVTALVGMASKYGEVLLGSKYREKNKQGEWVGGPMYYIEKGLGWKWLAVLFAFGLMVEAIPSTMVQANSISATVFSTFGVAPWLTGIVITLLTGVVVIGGIKRLGKVSEKIVPFMVMGYLLIALAVTLVNYDKIPEAFGNIFYYAFNPISATGGFAGAVVSQALRWGIARGAYSNEAGMGTAAIAQAPAQTDHPARQGLWGIFGVMMDTLIICTATGLAVLTSGAWTEIENPAAAVPTAMGEVLGGETAGGIFVSSFLLLFVLTTVGVLIYYGEKQAEYLFGLAFSKFMRYVYILAMFVGAVGGLQFIWQFLDILLALIVVPNMIALIAMSKEIRLETDDYIRRFYLPEKKKRKQKRSA